MANGIEGLDKLMKKYGQMAEQVAGETMERAVKASTKMVQGEARLLCPVFQGGGGGELRQSIQTSVEKQDEMVVGTIYTNKSYAAYVEFGTGKKGEENHAGISPLVTPAYTQSPWWIHESQVDEAAAEAYHWFYIDTPEGRFYQSTGQAAQPFMYPALKNNEDRATRNIANYLAREIKKVCK